MQTCGSRESSPVSELDDTRRRHLRRNTSRKQKRMSREGERRERKGKEKVKRKNWWEWKWNKLSITRIRSTLCLLSGDITSDFSLLSGIFMTWYFIPVMKLDPMLYVTPSDSEWCGWELQMATPHNLSMLICGEIKIYQTFNSKITSKTLITK